MQKQKNSQKRIDDIFAERVNDIKLAEHTMNVSAIETMRSQYLQFSRIKENISDGIK